MNRIDFLKLLATGGSSFVIGNFTGNNLSVELQEICIYDNFIKGVEHYKREFLKLKIEIGQEIQLKREISNVYDSFAIETVIGDKKIGYISAYENIVLANLMDKGVLLKARISSLEAKEGYLYNIIGIKVFCQLLVPINNLKLQDLTSIRADEAMDV